MYPHRIRLRGPWEVEAPESAPLRVHWGEHGLTGFTGRVCFRRRFGVPRRIDAHERVWVTGGGATGPARVWLNDELLGHHAAEGTSFEFPVLVPLRDRNELVIEVASGGLTGEVALEIRCAAYLRGVEAIARSDDGRAMLTVVGEVVGECERPLDLYVLWNGRNVAYQTVVARLDGQPFDLRFDPADGASASCSADHRLRMELVNGATVWYALERTVGHVTDEGNT